ncbi:MAG: DUF4124 domain-containing protein [Moraxellaceae bacterium]|nr:DUF4124 domain-containing protein [Pseudomonadales bacterium]MCB1673905.1 DUF4124 domain-containing protein [Pseudomonadales bacterium]MCP5174277.1 DUF4124 domain-containing protein [Moraxellaceae bacterium]MCP5176669.1 DUF4124 domain-containing protein [Moraxellaceae bacterium]HQV24004.1 DUF4124 domain-containing protein [Agitococcus sp.]
MRLVLLVTCLMASMAQAEIYKSYDKNGNVIFSDVPNDSAEKVEEKPIATVPALSPKIIEEKTKPIKDAKSTAVPNSYKITVSGLADQATIRKEAETFNAGIQFEPPLSKEHHITVSLDGKFLGKDAFSPSIEPSKLDRGQHRLEIKVLDKKQKIIQTESVDFFIQQPTVNKPKK